jgi:hypothetical protein
MIAQHEYILDFLNFMSKNIICFNLITNLTKALV